MKKARIKLWIILGIEFLAIISMLCLIYFAGKKSYTVRFELNGGVLISGQTEQRVTQGKDATAPVVTKKGCYLLKWSTSYSRVTQDLVVEAIWEYETSAGIEYTNSSASNYCEIAGSFDNIGGDVYIGAYYNNKKVLGIKEGAFQNRTRIKSIHLLDGILTIEDNVFAGCTNLETVVLPSTLIYLGANAFKGCENLKTVVVTDTLDSMTQEEIDEYMKKSVCELPDGLEYIGDGAFSKCNSLNEVYIPESVTTMGHGVFDKFVFQIVIPDHWRPSKDESSQESSQEESSQESSEETESDSSTSGLTPGKPIILGKRLVIYVYVPVKPKGWADDWYRGNPEIIWDYLELSDLDEKQAEEDSQSSLGENSSFIKFPIRGDSTSAEDSAELSGSEE